MIDKRKYVSLENILGIRHIAYRARMRVLAIRTLLLWFLYPASLGGLAYFTRQNLDELLEVKGFLRKRPRKRSSLAIN